MLYKGEKNMTKLLQLLKILEANCLQWEAKTSLTEDCYTVTIPTSNYGGKFENIVFYIENNMILIKNQDQKYQILSLKEAQNLIEEQISSIEKHLKSL